jgi:signal transduction histidine kinase
MTTLLRSTAPPRWRWWLALAAFLSAVAGVTALSLFGVELRRGDRDLTIVLALGIEIAFAVWGFLLGRSYEARAAERRAAGAAGERAEELAMLQARVARIEKLASLGQLAGSIAHEIRNPLAIVRTMVQNLAESGTAEPVDRERACTQLLEEIDRLARVTDSLVGLSRPVRPRLAAVKVREVLERVTWLAERMPGPRLSLRMPAHAAAAHVRADSDLLCQLLLGLIANAAQVTPGDDAIDLDCQADGETVTFAVTDSGPGVPVELRERIFEPLFTTRADGSGLGLAVARQIVDAHGGRISVEDVPGRGARFVVHLEAAST